MVAAFVSGTTAFVNGASSLDVEVQEEGAVVARRRRLNFIGADITAADDPSGDRANITLSVVGAGEINTASNVGTAGVGVFKQKTGVDLEFKKINAGSAKITITDDVANDEVDIDLGAHASTHENGGSDEINVAGLSGVLADAQTPASHAFAGAEHSTSTLASVNGKISDANLIDTGDTRLSDERTANAIATTGADVNVDASAPPTTGQVLKATSATAATWQNEAGGGGGSLDEYELSGGQMRNTVSGDRPATVDGNAPSVADTVNPSNKSLRHDDTDIEGKQWRRFIPSGALTMKILTEYRAEVAPGDAVHDWRGRLYFREHPDGGAAISATWAGTNDGEKDLAEVVNITDDVFPHLAPEETITLATEGILTGKFYDFIWARIAPAGTNLVGDLNILGHKIKVE